MLKYNRNFLIVVRAKLYNLLERKMINKIIEFFKKPSIRLILPIIGIVFIIVSSILLLWQGNENSNQAIPASTASVYFEGQYRIGDGEWKEIEKANTFLQHKATLLCVATFIC